VAGAEALPLREALRALRRAQPRALPNWGFVCQLMRLEARLRGASSVPPGAAAMHELAFLSHFDPESPERGRAEAAARAAREVAAGLLEAAASSGGGRGGRGGGSGGGGGKSGGGSVGGSGGGGGGVSRGGRADCAASLPSGARAAAGMPSGARRR